MLVKWFHHAIPARYDWEWLKRMGCYLDGSNPPAGFSNAGEKIYYWALVLAGATLVVSGFYLLFPNFGFERGPMQTANIVHAVSSLVLVAFVLLHIYLGTIGMRGAYDAMRHGYVDEAWAHEHHAYWYEDIQAGKIPAHRSQPLVIADETETPRPA